jgi:hypothetical protein
LRRTAGGSLFCSAPLPEGAAVAVVEETPAAVLASARAAAHDAQAALDSPPRFILVFDGAARRRIVAETIGSDTIAAALAGSFDEIPVIAGSYMRGEIGRTRGPFGDRTHEIVLVAFA